MRWERPDAPLILVGAASLGVVKLDRTKLYNNFPGFGVALVRSAGQPFKINGFSVSS